MLPSTALCWPSQPCSCQATAPSAAMAVRWQCFVASRSRCQTSQSHSPSANPSPTCRLIWGCQVLRALSRLHETVDRRRWSSTGALEVNPSYISKTTIACQAQQRTARTVFVVDCPMPCHVMPWHAIPLVCDPMPCLAMLCHAMPCLAMPCHALPCLAMLCHALPCYAMLCHALSCYAMLCHALPCLAMPYHALPCLALPCQAILCRALPVCLPPGLPQVQASPQCAIFAGGDAAGAFSGCLQPSPA